MVTLRYYDVRRSDRGDTVPPCLGIGRVPTAEHEVLIRRYPVRTVESSRLLHW
jgi:hypothetical protein